MLVTQAEVYLKSPQDRSRMSEARKLLQKAYRLYPTHAYGGLLYAKLLHGSRRHDDALEVLQNALREAPAYSDLHVMLGKVHRERDDWLNATKAFAHAIRLPMMPALYEEAKAALRELAAAHAKDGLDIRGLDSL